jgi:predicted ArsR family transcriptional regulator
MDDLLLSEIRLAAIAELLRSESVTFASMQKSIATSNGNLGAHLAKLVAAGYVSEEKTFVNRRPQTRYRLTSLGRGAFNIHVRQLQGLLKAAR